MPLPSTRDEFKDYILRRLGAPVLRMQVEDTQVEDRIDDAIEMWSTYHYDGASDVYLAHQVTAQDQANQYIDIDPSIRVIKRMLPLQSLIGSSSIFSLNYQFAQSDLLASALSSDSIVPLWMALTRVEFYQQILVGNKPIRYNHATSRIYIDMDWTYLNVGDYIMLEGTQDVDPEQYPGVWSDRWLLRYATALVKRQMGENTKKHDGVQMAGGVTTKGQVMWDEATDEIEKLEDQLMNGMSPIIPVLIG